MDGMHLSIATLEPSPHGGFLHPAHSALAARTDVAIRDVDAVLGVCCPSPGRLFVSPGLGSDPAAQAVVRFGLEVAWLRGLPGLCGDAWLLLAGRAAGCFLSCLPARDRFAASGPLCSVFQELAGDEPGGSRLLTLAAKLRETDVLPGPSRHDDATLVLGQVARLWRVAAACETLLVAGGDDRLRLDPGTGRNRYGCTPWPQPGLLVFSSSTASSISAEGLAAAEDLRQRLLAEMLHDPADQILKRHLAWTADAVLGYFDVGDLAEAVLTASGTDAALVMTALLQAEQPDMAITSILMSPAETGSGVPEAVRGRHFAPCSPSGAGVAKGASLEGAAADTALVTVALRHGDGTLREQVQIARDCDAAIRAATAQGRAVLHAIDGSKTGLSAPDRETCVALAARHGSRLDIVIDACQARIEPELVRFYLRHGFPVLVTGSKFFGAPGFCGAILFPRARLRRIAEAGALPSGLGLYVDLAGGIPQRRCPGLLLRWAAALHDMQGFKRLPTEQIRAGIDRFGHAVRARVLRDGRLSLFAAPRPPGSAWSGRRTVYTLALHDGGGRLGMDRLRPIYLAMGEDDPVFGRCQIGQPVCVGDAGAAGLRVSLSAGQIIRGDDVAPELAMVFTKLRALLDKRPPIG